jgi:anti-anti-sigma factor
MSQLTFHMIEDQQSVVLKLTGPFTQTEAEAFEMQTRNVAAKKPALLVLDLSGLTLITSAGLGALLRLQKTMSGQKCKIRMAALPAEIAKVLDAARLTDVFVVCPTVAEALN